MLILDPCITASEYHNLVVIYLKTGTDFYWIPEGLTSVYVEHCPSVGTHGIRLYFRNHQIV
jgi:hypothetical protein